MNIIKPLSPEEIEKLIGEDIPEVIIVAVNNLLKRNYKCGTATFIQDDLIKEIQKLDPKMTRSILFSNKWLDFEPIFERAGWNVEYDHPGYNEQYEPSFTLTKRWNMGSKTEII